MSQKWRGQKRCDDLKEIKGDIDKLNLSNAEKIMLKLSIDKLLEVYGCIEQ